MSSIRRFLQIESQFMASGREIPSEDMNAKAYVARAIEGDFRKAESYTLLEPGIDILQRIRTRIARGEFGEAKAELLQLEAEFILSPELSLELAEIFLERARLASFEAEWLLAINLCDEALRLGPAGVSQTTIRQVRSVALYELGLLDEAFREIERAQALVRIYPGGNLTVFISATEIKINIRKGRMDLARNQMQKLWGEIGKPRSGFNADTVSVLLRCEIDFMREHEIDFNAVAYASWLIAQSTGDDLYRGLAALDLGWPEEVEAAIERFDRIRKLLAEVETALEEKAISSSARSIRRGRLQAKKSAYVYESLTTISRLVLVKSGLSVSLKDLIVRPIKLTPKVRLALQTLAGGPVGKAEFFRAVWGAQRFVPEIHDSVIRTLLYRLRDQFGFNVRTESNLIQILDILVVDV